ncbi:MAG: hypothetical protein JSW40_05280, partial [Candidatus Omnitrophota bacterium]
SRRGISSFADDHELLGTAPDRGASASAAVAPRPVTSADSSPPAAEVQPPDRPPAASAPAAGQDWLSSPAVRSMQRRMARQQRTIRLLT